MGCLNGILVLDVTQRSPWAYVGMFLADYGADVIEVNLPSTVSTRGATATCQGSDEERVAAYLPFDRGKRSVTLDLEQETGRNVFQQLVERADVIVEGFGGDEAERLGLGYRRLHERNPRLIYCALSAFGQDGPYADIPATDTNCIAIGGALSLIGPRGGRPYIPSNIVGDFAALGTHAVIGVLLAVLARRRTGRGQLVDISCLDSVISILTPNTVQYFEGGAVPKRGDTPVTGSVPCAQVYKCKDDAYITAEAAEQHLWINFCRAVGREDLVPFYSPATVEEKDRVVSEFAAVFATRTRDEWWEYFKDKDTGVAPVYDLSETFRDPQVLHRQMLVEADHPTLGTVRQTGIPIKLSETPGAIRRLGVPAGHDTAEVLAELGYGEDEIAAMRESGAFG